jgi:GNAT superfamily N-acetyltransferase
MALTIRPGGLADTEWLLELFDEAVAWMVARGQPEQWGSEPWSAHPERVRRVGGLTRTGLSVAELDGEPVGALVVGDAPAYVPPPDRPELYVNLLLTSRRHAGRGIGADLVRVAVAQARAAGRDVVRVDCYAGAPALVAWYERQGFRRCGTFDVNGWPGQIFTMPVDRGDPHPGRVTPSPSGGTRSTGRSPTRPGGRSRTPRTTRCD